MMRICFGQLYFFNTRADKLAGKIFVLLLVSTGCIDPYTPSTTAQPVNYLIVDGILNTADTTRFKLSRSSLVSSGDSAVAEKNAIVSVEPHPVLPTSS